MCDKIRNLFKLTYCEILAPQNYNVKPLQVWRRLNMFKLYFILVIQ